METGCAVTAFICMALNAMLPEEMEDDIAPSAVEHNQVEQIAMTKGEELGEVQAEHRN